MRRTVRHLSAVFAVALGGAVLSTGAMAETPSQIPSAGGQVALPTETDRKEYDLYHFAQVRRAGDYVYVSGVIAGRRGDEGRDVAAFKDQVRRAFKRIEVDLRAAGVGFSDVVMITSFHVWNGPNFTGTRDEQFAAFGAVKDEFMPAPYPAWTAVGTTGLLADGGVVEIQVIAYAPQRAAR